MAPAALPPTRGVQVPRQHAVGPYILDFYCAATRLAVEVDGSQHYTPSGLADDAVRMTYLRSAGVEMLRLTNVEVLTNPDGVALAILHAVGGHA